MKGLPNKIPMHTAMAMADKQTLVATSVSLCPNPEARLGPTQCQEKHQNEEKSII